MRDYDIDKEELLAREDKIACLGVDRAYAWHMRDHKFFKKKLAIIKRKCKPGYKLGAYQVVSAYEHHCLLRSPRGRNINMSYIELAKMITVRKASQKLHTL